MPKPKNKNLTVTGRYGAEGPEMQFLQPTAKTRTAIVSGDYASLEERIIAHMVAIRNNKCYCALCDIIGPPTYHMYRK
jgi:hypothetical protein